jgi:hypothetical protein
MERGRERERQHCLGVHVLVNRSTCGLVVGWAFIPSSLLFSFFFSILPSPGCMSSHYALPYHLKNKGPKGTILKFPENL